MSDNGQWAMQERESALTERDTAKQLSEHYRRERDELLAVVESMATIMVSSDDQKPVVDAVIEAREVLKRHRNKLGVCET